MTEPRSSAEGEGGGGDSADRARRFAKRDLIAHMAVIAKLFDERAEAIRAHIEALKGKDVDEWEATEGILATVFGTVEELGLTRLCAKLVIYQIANLEYRRSIVKVS